METVTHQDFTDHLRDQHGNRTHIAEALETDDLASIHNDYLFDALCDTDPASHHDLRDEFTTRDDIHTATELAIEHFSRTYDESLHTALPRDLIDNYLRATSSVLTDALNGAYDEDD